MFDHSQNAKDVKFFVHESKIDKMWLLFRLFPFFLFMNVRFLFVQQCFLLHFISPLQSEAFTTNSIKPRARLVDRIQWNVHSAWSCLGWHFEEKKKRFFTIFLYYSVRYFSQAQPKTNQMSVCDATELCVGLVLSLVFIIISLYLFQRQQQQQQRINIFSSCFGIVSTQRAQVWRK